jgi:ribosomal protein RSM22 (predicted rRNA methylase)
LGLRVAVEILDKVSKKTFTDKITFELKKNLRREACEYLRRLF